jgi:ferredoxin
MKTFSIFFLIAVVALDFNADAFQQSRRTARSSGNRVKGSSLHMTVLSYNGKKKDFKPGSPLKSAVASLGVKPKYSCQKGDCASCQLTVGGQRMRPCVAKVPPEPRLKSLQEKGLEIK